MLRVQTIYSAISAGSELLVYRGLFPRETPDPHDSISSDLRYPIAYGYACVGRVREVSPPADPGWMDRLVFAFRPHTSQFVAAPADLLIVPQEVSAEAAVFLPSMETAVSLIQDGAPVIGERVMVLGQGLVGLLTSALLCRMPLLSIISSDCYAARRQASLALGLRGSLDPKAAGFKEDAESLLGGKADLTIEISGQPEALDDAIGLTCFSGRILLGSWYGEKPAILALGGSFHRSRIKLIASQVSTISPELSTRWDKARRFGVAWRAIAEIGPQKWISHTFPIEQADQAFELLDHRPADALQVVLTYGQ